MKKILLLSRKPLFLLFISLIIGITTFLTSCEREEDTIYCTGINYSESVINPFSFEIKDNIISFPSIKDYEAAIIFLDSMGNNIDYNWAAEEGFISMRAKYVSLGKEDKMPIQNELITCILNPEGQVIIADKIFRLDASKERVYVESLAKEQGKEKATEVNSYGFEEEVMDLVFASGEMSSNYDKVDEATCVSKQLGTDFSFSATTVTIECDYQSYGIYFQLKVEIKKSTPSNYIEIYYGITGHFLRIKGYTYDLGIKKRSDGGNNLNYVYRPYSSMKRLVNYSFETDYWGYDRFNLIDFAKYTINNCSYE